MSKNLSVKKQKHVILHMLSKKFPDVQFLLTAGNNYTSGGVPWESFMRVEFDTAKYPVDIRSVSCYLDKFSDDEPDVKGIAYLRTYWINEQGHAVLARIRAKHPDGTHTLVDKNTPPETGGPYKLGRFSINSYRVSNLATKKRPYRHFDYDE